MKKVLEKLNNELYSMVYIKNNIIYLINRNKGYYIFKIKNGDYCGVLRPNSPKERKEKIFNSDINVVVDSFIKSHKDFTKRYVENTYKRLQDEYKEILLNKERLETQINKLNNRFKKFKDLEL